MSSNESLIPTLISGGFGAGIATVVVALVQTIGKRGETRAAAADLITDAAGDLAARQAEVIARLEKRVERQAMALVMLTDVLDELLPQLSFADPAEQHKLRKAVTAAKLAL